MRTLQRIAVTSRASALIILFVLVFVYFSVSQREFLTVSNMQSVASGSGVLWMTTIGVAIVMIGGGFDLSVGSSVALSGLILAWLFTDLGLPIACALPLAIIAGCGLGFVNGFLVGKLKLSSLVVTLATFALYQGLTDLWAGTGGGKPASSHFLGQIAYNNILGIPLTVWVCLGATLLASYLLHRSYLGRDIYAMGGNPEAARLAGINIGTLTILIYVLGGMFAACATSINVGLLSSASPLVGQNMMLTAATAALLGGISLGGGAGTIGGACVGVLFLTVVNNGLSIAGLTGAWQNVVQGGLLIVAVTIDKLRTNRLERGREVAEAEEVVVATDPLATQPERESTLSGLVG